MDKESANKATQQRNHVRMPADFLLYERIIPALLLILAAIMVVVLLVALGFLIGIVPYQ